MRISDGERRARLVTRHHLGRTAADVVEGVRSVVALHSSDPITPHLSLRARLAAFVTDDLDGALYESRTLWRLHGMRRTLFVAPVQDAAVIDAAVSRDIAARERRKLETWVGAEMPGDRGRAWLADTERRVMDTLADGGEWRTRDVSAAVPGLATPITVGSGKWTAQVPVSTRLLFLMALDGHVVRTRPAGSWRSSQYRWAATSRWFGRPRPTVDAAAGRADLARRYLAAYGPATMADLRWWTGWTAKLAVPAVRAVGAVSVDLDSGGQGFVLPDDRDSPDTVGPAVAFLPGLDATAMGWKERGWYVGPHAAQVFDRNGNAGPTVWVDGRVVGGWAQRPTGEVVWRLLEDVGAEAHTRVEQEAAALSDWMGGVVATPRFRSPLDRALSG